MTRKVMRETHHDKCSQSISLALCNPPDLAVLLSEVSGVFRISQRGGPPTHPPFPSPPSPSPSPPFPLEVGPLKSS